MLREHGRRRFVAGAAQIGDGGRRSRRGRALPAPTARWRGGPADRARFPPPPATARHGRADRRSRRPVPSAAPTSMVKCERFFVADAGPNRQRRRAAGHAVPKRAMRSQARSMALSSICARRVQQGHALFQHCRPPCAWAYRRGGSSSGCGRARAGRWLPVPAEGRAARARRRPARRAAAAFAARHRPVDRTADRFLGEVQHQSSALTAFGDFLDMASAPSPCARRRG